jgi:hypothetical protein
MKASLAASVRLLPVDVVSRSPVGGSGVTFDVEVVSPIWHPPPGGPFRADRAWP